VFEKTKSFQEQHLPSLTEITSLYLVKIDTSTHLSPQIISAIPDSYSFTSIL
jgi:hypothetical protein